MPCNCPRKFLYLSNQHFCLKMHKTFKAGWIVLCVGNKVVKWSELYGSAIALFKVVIFKSKKSYVNSELLWLTNSLLSYHRCPSTSTNATARTSSCHLISGPGSSIQYAAYGPTWYYTSSLWSLWYHLPFENPQTLFYSWGSQGTKVKRFAHGHTATKETQVS